MTKADFIHCLADAIQAHEGWSATTGTAFPNLNPGNLRYAGQANAIPVAENFAKFPSFQDGKQAQLNDLTAKLDAGLNTIADIITRYESGDPSNDVPAYIQFVVEYFHTRNVPITDTTPIDAFIASTNVPVVVIAINNLWQPADWSAIQATIADCATFMPNYSFSCRYSDVDLSQSVISVNTIISPATSMISPTTTRNVLLPYNDGAPLNVMIYDGTVMQGHPTPAGGCEYQGETLSPVSSVSSVMYQGPDFTDPDARVLFHELIHELFALTEQIDILHQYLSEHGGYNENLLTDLEAVFTGNQLNTPVALSNLKNQKAEI